MKTLPLAPTAALSYILQGQGTFTIEGKSSRYTFKESVADKDSRDTIFVKLLTGSDNESDYQYIGYIKVGTNTIQFQAGKKGNAAHPAFKALNWYLHQLAKLDAGNADQAKFWHEGVCCRCGRKLTTPESVSSGIGPECSKRSH